MFEKQMNIMAHNPGFVAALDQSGGSSPKALKAYGVGREAYDSEDEMFQLIHQMRTRVVTSPAFTNERVLGAILFEQTMDRTVGDLHTADYLWKKKGIVPFLKVDKGLAPEDRGVRLMKPNPDLDQLLQRAIERNVFGTKMRSVISEADPAGIAAIVQQQFEWGTVILEAGLIPILEPEVDIGSPDKNQSEELLKTVIMKHLATLPKGRRIMLKLSLPTVPDFYADLIAHPNVLRVVALSGGYSRDEACRLLEQNPGLIASFSRALLEGLHAEQTDAEFNQMLGDSIEQIYQASVR